MLGWHPSSGDEKEAQLHWQAGITAQLSTAPAGWQAEARHHLVGYWMPVCPNINELGIAGK